MNNEIDRRNRLNELLAFVHRQRDIEQGGPLKALLAVITEQVNLVEDDISQLYENWFIETCQDWVVPYIGELIGYSPVHEAGEPGDVSTAQGAMRNKILTPRREIANTIRNRRRKGTLALLELLAYDVAGWPARAVEYFKLLSAMQNINHLHPQRGRTADLRRGGGINRLGGPFDPLAHNVDVRSVKSHRAMGRHNIPEVGLFVWRLKSYSVTRTPAHCAEDVGPHCFSFSLLGNDTPLFNKPVRETEPTHIAEELNLPVPIRRRAFEERYREEGRWRVQASSNYYGENKSVTIWAPGWPHKESAQPVPAKFVIPADLTDWRYRPARDHIAVDPVLGRIIFPTSQLPKRGVRVVYHYGFSGDIGGGEYNRPLFQPSPHALFQVGERERFKTIRDAVDHWRSLHPRPQNAVVEITDSGVYREQLNIRLRPNHSLQIRAANRRRPVLRLLDWETDRPDALSVTGGPGSRFILDGLLITGRAIHVEGDLDEVAIRHSTLVPGWAISCDCEPRRPAEPSLEIYKTVRRVTIEHSILGSIQINQDEVKTDPITFNISDSVVDAVGEQREAIGAPGWPRAHAVLTLLRSTVFGQIQTNSIQLAENCIFMGILRVRRRQYGCIRFCYVTPGSRTPRRYHCQPDLVEAALKTQKGWSDLSEEERERAIENERLRVRPVFNSVRYGTPTYCQLAESCAEEIKRGADDESEMGVFHNLFQPQRHANLRVRLDEFMQAGMDAGIIYAS
jgi:hypothetical protein